MQTFMITQKKMAEMHWESKHGKNKLEECFPALAAEKAEL